MKMHLWWLKRWKSIGYACTGLFRFLRTEHNTWLYLAATIGALLCGVIVGLPFTKWAILILTIALVWICELFNTCLEKSMDIITTENDQRIKYVKDLAAGAVWFAAITSLVIGALLFIPEIN